VGRLQPGESVLVQGAAGGVGTVAGQLAKAAGAGAVYGVVSAESKAAYARGHGYDEVFVGDFEKAVREATGGRGVDLALDPVGGETFRAGLASLAVFGRLVSFGNASGEPAWTVGQPELYPSGLSVAGFSILTLARTAPAELRALVERAFAKAVDGTVSLPVTAEFGLEEAAEAHRLMGARTSTGKLLLRVGAEQR
jgi:NADPH2:quinone reductase